jgi:hypothetical protein
MPIPFNGSGFCIICTDLDSHTWNHEMPSEP